MKIFLSIALICMTYILNAQTNTVKSKPADTKQNDQKPINIYLPQNKAVTNKAVKAIGPKQDDPAPIPPKKQVLSITERMSRSMDGGKHPATFYALVIQSLDRIMSKQPDKN